MSKFSDKLKQLLDESGIKIYQLAKNAELDRTTIQRAMTGERLPSIPFVEKLCAYLRVSPHERAEIFELYAISKIGEKVYAGRKYIKEIIEGVATTRMIGEDIISTKKNVIFTGKINEDSAVYTGQYIVNNMIRDILEDEVINSLSPRINISVPFQYSFLYDLLYQLYLSKNGRINIKNIVKLNKNPRSFQNSNCNLEVLSHVMPFAFSAGDGYQPYYFYDSYDASNDIALIMPYHITTSKRLITLSADFKTAILYNNENIINAYKGKFDNAIIQSVPFTEQHFNCDGALNYYLQSYKKAGIITHVIEQQPCFAWYYTDDLIQSHLRPDLENRDLLYHLLCELYGIHSNFGTKPMSVFSVEGLGAFVATGILGNLPTQYAIPFSVEERIVLLNNLRNDICNDSYRVYAANSSKFFIPSCSIELYNKTGIDFLVISSETMASAYIDEISIAEAFYDFFESLPSSDLVFNKEETIKIIDGFIEQCKAISKYRTAEMTNELSVHSR